MDLRDRSVLVVTSCCVAEVRHMPGERVGDRCRGSCRGDAVGGLRLPSWVLGRGSLGVSACIHPH